MFYPYVYSSIFYLCFFISFITCFIVNNCPPRVIVGETEIVGNLKRGSNYIYEEFLGIPYAKPPVGELRFKEPVPYKMTGDRFSATKDGSICIQYTLDQQIRGSEDCLYLNIYRPHIVDLTTTPLLDVIVYIHGGTFMFGEPAHSLKLLERRSDQGKDVYAIFVNFNYRLGPIGFMSTGDDALPGNMGLKDQVLALKWVKENIHYFHGNAGSITLSGSSVGAASVQLHMMSPLSKNLFHRAIMSSGSALNPWALAKAVPNKTEQIAASLNCTTQDSYEMVRCLRTKKAEDIVAQVTQFLVKYWYIKIKHFYIPFTTFGPVIESPTSSRAFLTQHPYDLLKTGQVTQVPILVGITTGEGIFPIFEFLSNKIVPGAVGRKFISYILDFRYTLDNTIMEVAMEDMIGWYRLKKTARKTFPHRFVEMIGDRLFGSGIAESALMYAAVSDQPVYMYRFGYIGSRSLIKHFNLSKIDEFGASHGEDCHYILDFDDDSTVESEDDYIMSEKMTRMWGEFVSNSIPKLEENIFLADMREKLPRLSYIEIESPSRMYVTSTENMANMIYWREYLLREIATIGKKDESSSSPLELSYFPLIMLSSFVGLLVLKYLLHIVHEYLSVITVKIYHVLWRKHHS